MNIKYTKQLNIFLVLAMIGVTLAGFAPKALADAPVIWGAGLYPYQVYPGYQGPVIMDNSVYMQPPVNPIIPDYNSISNNINQQEPVSSYTYNNTNTTPTYTNNNYQNQTTYTPPVNAQATATTIGASAVHTYSATLSGSWSTNSQQVATWFEYGPSTTNMNIVTKTQYQSASSGVFSDTITGLTANSTFYYRAVAEVNGNFAYGAVKTLQTLEAGTGGSQVLGTSTSSPLISTITPNAVATGISANAGNQSACQGDTVNYTLNYSNTTSGTISNAMIVVTMPGSIDYTSSTAQGTYDSRARTVTIFIGSMAKGQSGVVYIQGKANASANGTATIATRVDFTYAKADGSTQTNTSYVMHSGMSCGTTLGANVLGAGFLPTSFAGWVILIILICAIVFIARKYFGSNEDAHGHGAH